MPWKAPEPPVAAKREASPPGIVAVPPGSVRRGGAIRIVVDAGREVAANPVTFRAKRRRSDADDKAVVYKSLNTDDSACGITVNGTQQVQVSLSESDTAALDAPAFLVWELRMSVSGEYQPIAAGTLEVNL